MRGKDTLKVGESVHAERHRAGPTIETGASTSCSSKGSVHDGALKAVTCYLLYWLVDGISKHACFQDSPHRKQNVLQHMEGREKGGNISAVFIRSGQNSYWMFDKKNSLCLLWLVVQQALHVYSEKGRMLLCHSYVTMLWFKVKKYDCLHFPQKLSPPEKSVCNWNTSGHGKEKKLSQCSFWLVRMFWQCNAGTFASFSLPTFNTNFELFRKNNAQCLLGMRRWQGRKVGQKCGGMACKVAAI